ncbi:MAG: class I SAM-dependent methyltransferase [Thermoflexales bacterium]|nr:class I SAM-dependent methyltransferase [Thermoflexales bacterium]MCS7323758.1 class I SAM-dependent methyltransferase [Thermoflexales bacterium]MCX7938677.1 class I SAM-dependent methyltransferase [Thermoflexales bacterium]MDW8053864.1 class I SAM-dependent methyltransferase [Anaerolineae bacterium]MDW8292395.1 class I SAM-dependent methyltransferase [Anaerolineae bacterium]
MPHDLARPANHDFLWPQLAELPFFRALLRAVEARFYQSLPVEPPVLDLGCGDGSFAAHAFAQPLDVGLDPWRAPLREAQRRQAHRLLALADGGHMPFADGTFQTIVSNSVLEHIPHLDRVLAECARVLRPGGYLLFCAPSDHFTDWLIGGCVLGERYRRWFNRISRHHHCDGPERWHMRLAAAGLVMEHWWYYFSPRALRALELGHYLGVPNLISRLIFGRWVLFPSRRNPLLRLIEAALRPIYNEPLPEVGAYIFGVARKPPA